MGRGRAKAKQTKVARALKYSPMQSDLSALQAELTGHGDEHVNGQSADAEIDDELDEDEDPYAKESDDDDALR